MALLRRRRSPVEQAIGYVFRRKELLTAALTHPSCRAERKGAAAATDNQRLEFLGDAVLGFVVAACLYRKHADREEGELTALRSRVTSGRALAGIAEDIELGESLQVGRGEEASGGRSRPSNLGDALEAVIGAAYLDGGIRAAEKIVMRLVMPALESGSHDVWEGNPKGWLQDHAQRKMRTSPEYRTVREAGPSHEKRFTVEVRLRGKVVGAGTGRSRREAEAKAAARAVAKLSGSRRGGRKGRVAAGPRVGPQARRSV